jgi:hypothetical protein
MVGPSDSMAELAMLLLKLLSVGSSAEEIVNYLAWSAQGLKSDI